MSTERSRTPDLIVVGSKRSGSTFLHQLLDQSGGVFVPAQKELHYFTAALLDATANGPGDIDANTRIVRSWEDYVGHFEAARPEQRIAEVSPSYFFYAKVAATINTRLPTARVLVLLRDPIEKAFSQWSHLRLLGREELTFVEALEAEPERTAAGWNDMWAYAASGLYTERLSAYLDTFGPDRVTVLYSRSLFEEPLPQLNRVLSELGVEPLSKLGPVASPNPSGRPRSRAVQQILGVDTPAKAALRAFVPKSTYRRLSALARGANLTMDRPEPEALDRLRPAFIADGERLAKLLGHEPPWLDHLRSS